MAVSAKFGRANAPTSPTSLDWDGFDYRPPRGYQMVPWRGARLGQLVVAGGRVSVFSGNSEVVKISAPPSPPQPKLVFDHPARTVLDLTYHGLSEGRTIVGAFGPDGALLDAIVISVKKPRRLNYNLHILRDALRPKDPSQERTLAELSQMLKTVEKAYLNQANIILTKGKENILTLKTDLGDPFDPDEKRWPLRKTTHEVIEEMLDDGKFTGLEDLNIVSTWNIEDEAPDRLVLGITGQGAMISYVERIDGGIKETCTIAHEMGHALGLPHNMFPGTMMAPASGAAPSFVLLRGEIDRINGSAGGRLQLTDFSL